MRLSPIFTLITQNISKMLVKILLKIWFAVVPVLIYLIWVFITTILVEKIRKICKKDTKTNKNNDFRSKISLSNKNFVISIYLGLVLLIFALIFGVFVEEKNFTQTTIDDLKKKVKVE